MLGMWVVWQVLDLRRALHAEPGSAEALRLAALRGDHVSAPPPAPAAPAAPAHAPHHHTFDAVMQHHALRTHATVLHATNITTFLTAVIYGRPSHIKIYFLLSIGGRVSSVHYSQYARFLVELIHATIEPCGRLTPCLLGFFLR